MRRIAFPALLATLVLPGPVAGQQEAFIMLRGSDTIAIEAFRRTPGKLDVDLVERLTKSRHTFAVTIGRDGTVSRVENQYRRADATPDAKPLQTAVLLMVGDSVIAEITGPTGTRIQRLGTRPGALPYVNPSMALVELMLARATALGGDSVAIPMFFVAGGQTLTATVRRVGADSAVVAFAMGQDFRLARDREGRILGGAIPAQGLTVVRTTVKASALFVPPPDYSAPPDAPYTAEEVTVPTPMGHTLAGTLTVPRGRGPWPVVITISGSGSQDRDEEIAMVRGYRPFRQIADTLGRMGIAVLRMDDRGFGASGGDAATATSADFARDIEAGVAFIRARRGFDGKRVFLLGHSEGGIIGPMVAAADPALGGLVIMAGPAQRGRDIIEFQNRYAIERTTTIRPEARDSVLRAALHGVDSVAATSPWIKYFLDYDPLPTARRVRVPTLILQGATDQQITAEQAETLGAAIRSGGNADVTVQVFADANHLFIEDPSGNPAGYTRLTTGEIRGDVIKVLTEWLARRAREAR
ncbi:MAG TPA: alpha/beta fold hydrolase [Gemmatimonadales bacterium]